MVKLLQFLRQIEAFDTRFHDKVVSAEKIEYYFDANVSNVNDTSK